MKDFINEHQLSPWLVIQGLLFATLLAIAGFVVAGELDTDRALTGLALIAVAVALGALRPSDVRELVGRIREVGPLKLEARVAETAADQNLGTEAEGDEAAGYQGSMLDLRIKLEYKLAYIAKSLLGEVRRGTDVSGSANFVTVGSLKYDGFLSLEQARTATSILTWTDDDLSRASPQAAAAFLSDANALVSGIRATVFANLVRKHLESAKWKVTTADRKKKRRDLIATSPDGSQVVRIVPVFALSEPSSILGSVKKRLEELDKKGERYVIVLPDRSRAATSETPRVVRLEELLGALA